MKTNGLQHSIFQVTVLDKKYIYPNLAKLSKLNDSYHSANTTGGHLPQVVSNNFDVQIDIKHNVIIHIGIHVILFQYCRINKMKRNIESLKS